MIGKTRLFTFCPLCGKRVLPKPVTAIDKDVVTAEEATDALEIANEKMNRDLEQILSVSSENIIRILREEHAAALVVKDVLKEELTKLREENARLRSVLELIACPERPDGTYNRDRKACELLAKETLEKSK